MQDESRMRRSEARRGLVLPVTSCTTHTHLLLKGRTLTATFTDAMVSREGAHRARDEETRGAINATAVPRGDETWRRRGASLRREGDARLCWCAASRRCYDASRGVVRPTEDAGVLVEPRARLAAATSSTLFLTRSWLTDDRERLLPLRRTKRSESNEDERACVIPAQLDRGQSVCLVRTVEGEPWKIFKLIPITYWKERYIIKERCFNMSRKKYIYVYM